MRLFSHSYSKIRFSYCAALYNRCSQNEKANNFLLIDLRDFFKILGRDKLEDKLETVK